MNIKKALLIFYELNAIMESAIEREKRIKGGFSKKKVTLIATMNQVWRGL